VQLYLPTDQALPQELVNAFFRRRIPSFSAPCTGSRMRPDQKAVDQYKAEHK
jgi:hypothetical protein